ncbi:MAG: hypothetical protein NTW86_31330 [Candidatus Sumerlaeota bacterium]|nr:hypothetical protein [Candidatus Sumerlaeota bacterium]
MHPSRASIAAAWRLAAFAMALPGAGFLFAAEVELPASLPASLAKRIDLQPIPWLDPTGFLPPRHAGGNAAELYAQAVQHIHKAAGYPRLPRELKDCLEDAELRESLRLAVEGSALEQADFLALYSYRAWDKDGLPDLTGALAAQRALARSAQLFADAKEFDKARDTARAALGMGEHYRRAAPSLAQALIGETMMEDGMLALRHMYLESGDRANARETAQRLARCQSVGEAAPLRNAAVLLDLWKDPAMALRACADPDPIVRSDTLLLIEACFHPDGWKRMQSDPDSSAVATRLRADKSACQKAVASLLNDPSPIVSKLAKRVEGVLK